MLIPRNFRRLAAMFATAAVAAVAVPTALAQQGSAEERLKPELLALGFPEGKLPQLKPAFGNYVDSVPVGNMLFLSSAAPQRPDGQFVKGRVPDEVSPSDAAVAAKLACIRQLARIKLVVGDLDRVKRVVYVKSKVMSQPGFTDQTKIADACSSIYVTAFGEPGRHARTTDGVTANPFNVTVEVETFVELK